jgi:hypothetical protein
MSWETFYLVCFLVGFLLSLVAFLGEAVHFHGHVPHLGNHAHAGAAAHHVQFHQEVSPFNLMTLTAFLAWFGGTGYLLERYAGLWTWIAFGIASVSGLGGAAFVFWALGKLLAHDRNLDPADYDMIGVLGRVSSSVREGGTGEMVFSQAGARRAVPVRSEDGRPIGKGTEVVVTRYEKGVAYVQLWQEVVSSE